MIITGATLEQAKVVIEHGVVPKFVELLASEKHDLQKLVNNSILFAYCCQLLILSIYLAL